MGAGSRRKRGDDAFLKDSLMTRSESSVAGATAGQEDGTRRSKQSNVGRKEDTNTHQHLLQPSAGRTGPGGGWQPVIWVSFMPKPSELIIRTTWEHTLSSSSR